MKTYLAVLNGNCHLILLLFLLPLHCMSQRQDFVWYSGYGSSFVEDTGWNSRFGINKLDFNQTPVLISHDSLGMGITNTNVSYCDTDGHILFYCNGIYIANSLDEKIENSDSMNAGYFTFQWIDPAVGNYVGQGILALKSPLEDSKFYLIHSFIDTVNANFSFGCKKVLFTLLDMDANIGHGSVLQKDQVILNGSFAAELKATRHANGRDWWILVQKRGTNCYEKILLDNTGFHATGTTCGGQSVIGLSGSACFSQDGSKYVYVGMYGGINLFDFDRCSGNLTNPQYFPLPIFQDSGAIGIGSAFSPNSRFLYVNATIHCYQFDLWADDIWTSIDTVAFYDGAQNPFGSVFHTMQIAPDGKIYSSCGNGEYVYHVIERPDEKGDSCLFIQHGVILPSYSGGGLPNFPNYRLGALPNSPCDTLTSLNDTEKSEKEKHINIFPNPATDFITVDYGFTDWNKGEATFQILYESGQLTLMKPLPKYSGFQKIDVSLWASGNYLVSVIQNQHKVATTKFTIHR